MLVGGVIENKYSKLFKDFKRKCEITNLIGISLERRLTNKRYSEGLIPGPVNWTAGKASYDNV